MYLQKFETVGFKSFTDKTALDFLAPTASSKGVTAIVGPNGSGKSNVADAVRWVLGEQSAKLLRGKKAEDVIFSGSQKRARSNFAEAILHLNNEDGALPLDLSEVTIARRVYRNGDSEYLINKKKVRLTDIQLLLAEANFGARTYSVIGQGMIDSILVASPQERKEFFDEAAGVRQFQIKRHQSVNKISAAKENLAQAEMLITEIEPRLRSLSRQVKRLDQRESLEEELHALLHQHYGGLWTELKSQLDACLEKVGMLKSDWKEKESMLETARKELAKLEKEETGDDAYSSMHANYEKLLEEKNSLHARRMKAKSQMEIAEQVQKQVARAMPLSRIIERVGSAGRGQATAISELKQADSLDKAVSTVPAFEQVHESIEGLRQNLERPAPEVTEEKQQQDPDLLKEIKKFDGKLKNIEEKIRKAQDELRGYSQGETKKKEKFFSLQRILQDKIGSAHALERQLNEEKIELAKLETRREALEQEMEAELSENAERAKASYTPDSDVDRSELVPNIEKLKYKLQLIGGIDPEVVREHEETRSRYEFLESQINDLRKAISDLERVIAELDFTIKARSDAAFRRLNKGFDRFFKTLFGGGKAELKQVKEQEVEQPEGEGSEDADMGGGKVKEQVAGIEIMATPPGKKITNITMLSGGERALTSIALICAILDNNPSPFVVLDEVDAALDESNSEKFATILEELSVHTQFIIITHNRYTMRRANVLYGVTMHDDGTSHILSINMDEVDTLKGRKKKEKARG